jgi:hypothetical protein
MTYVHDKPSITGPDDYVIRYFYKPEGPRYIAIRGVGPGGFTTVYGYDPVQRLALMGNDLAGTGNDVDVTPAYRPFFCLCLSRSRTMLPSPSGIRPMRRATS